MLNSKYSKILTVILIIAIMVIIGLLIFVGIDLYKAYNTNADVDDFDQQFNSFVEGTTSNQPQNNNEQFQNSTVQNAEVEDPDIPLDTNTSSSGGSQSGGSGSSSSGGSSSSNTLKYKGFDVLGKIEIPKINVKYYLLEEYSPKALETSVVVIYGPGPNQVGNTVIAGHNYRNGTFFSNNKKLENGDKIYITDLTGKKVTYQISRHYIADENDFSYAVRDTGGKRAISLSTCTDDSKNRLIIWAEEV